MLHILQTRLNNVKRFYSTNLRSWRIFSYFRARKRLTILGALLVSFIMHQEVVSYWWKSRQWAVLSGSRDDTLRSWKVLLVADPQLQGFQNEPKRFWIGKFSRWDAYQYIRKGFRLAFAHLQPNLVVYLGDLIDEGVEATEAEYDWTVGHFHRIFKRAKSVPNIYIAGDNDIGGEWGSSIQPRHKDRFSRAFISDTQHLPGAFPSVNFAEGRGESRQVKVPGAVLTPPFFSNYGANAFDGSFWYLSRVPHGPGNGAITLLLSHHRMIGGDLTTTDHILEMIKPHLVFSAHDHKARIFRRATSGGSMEETVQPAKDSSEVYHYTLSAQVLTEINVPTCSYRMGTKEMGYGALLIEETRSGSFRVSYTILWLPERYQQLYRYIGALLLLAFGFWVNCCYSFSRHLALYRNRRAKSDENWNEYMKFSRNGYRLTA